VSLIAMFDLVIRRANLPDGRTCIDIGITDGRFAAIYPDLPVGGRVEIDATDRLVTPPFVWTRRCRSACHGSMFRARCLRALPFGAS
jgi:cytosine/adenosine deaminase-related metal-dependent hydrolase